MPAVKSQKPVKPRNCPPGLNPHVRGWSMRVNGDTKVIAGIHASFDEVLRRFYQKKSIAHGQVVHAVVPQVVAAPVVVAPAPVVKSMALAELREKYLTNLTSRFQVSDYSAASLTTMRTELPKFVAFFPGYTVAQLTPEDFMRFRISIGKLSVNSISRMITNVRCMFNWAVENEVISSHPRWGKSFEKPKASQLRKHRNQKRDIEGGKEFTPAEIKKLLDGADARMKAMVLLGLNGGFGNEDLAGMPLSVLRLPEAMISYSRPKSGVRRRVPLWPETVDALNKWLAVRPDGSTSVNDSLVFLTETGTPMIQWHLDDEKHSKTDMIVMKFNRLSRRVGIWRKGFGFYVLRHTFRTNGRKLHDQMAVDFIMGHLSTDGAKMAETYIERTDDDVLLRVTDHVRSIVLKDYLASSANELVTFGNDYRVPPLDLT